MEITPPGSSRTVPLKGLLALTAAVLLIHLALLQATPMALGLSQAPPARAFITRAIALVPAGQTSAVQTTIKTPVKPVTRPQRQTPAPARAVGPLPADLQNNSEPTPAPPAKEESGMAEAETKAAASPDPSPPEITAAQADPPPDIEPPAAAPRPPRERLSSVGAVAVPGSVRLKYQVDTNKFPFGANAELLWQQDGENYEARLEFSAFGLSRVQNSRGSITPQGLAPLRFSDKYRSEVAAHFNREQGKVTFSANTPDAPLLAGAQDRLSILVQLGAMIAGDPGHYPTATTIALQAIGPRDAETWLFTVGEVETLALPGGEQATLKLVRNPRREFDQKVELWLAPALGYLPVRVRITDANGDFVEQKWLALEPHS
jgi:hypothetical protein